MTDDEREDIFATWMCRIVSIVVPSMFVGMISGPILRWWVLAAICAIVCMGGICSMIMVFVWMVWPRKEDRRKALATMPEGNGEEG